jgi:hypothetical protein
MRTIPKPEPTEYAPYVITYISLLPDDGLILKHLDDNLRTTTELMLSLPEEKLTGFASKVLHQQHRRRSNVLAVSNVLSAIPLRLCGL